MTQDQFALLFVEALALLGAVVFVMREIGRRAKQDNDARARDAEQAAKRLADMERDLSEYRVTAAMAEQRTSQLENHNQSLIAQIGDLKQGGEENKREIAVMQSILQDRQQTIAFLQKDIGELRERVAVLTAARDAANEERDALLSENRILKAERDALERRIKALEEEQQHDRKEIASLRQQVSELSARLDKHATSELQPIAEAVMP